MSSNRIAWTVAVGLLIAAMVVAILAFQSSQTQACAAGTPKPTATKRATPKPTATVTRSTTYKIEIDADCD